MQKSTANTIDELQQLVRAMVEKNHQLRDEVATLNGRASRIEFDTTTYLKFIERTFGHSLFDTYEMSLEHVGACAAKLARVVYSCIVGGAQSTHCLEHQWISLALFIALVYLVLRLVRSSAVCLLRLFVLLRMRRKFEQELPLLSPVELAARMRHEALARRRSAFGVICLLVALMMTTLFLLVSISASGMVRTLLNFFKPTETYNPPAVDSVVISVDSVWETIAQVPSLVFGTATINRIMFQYALVAVGGPYIMLVMHLLKVAMESFDDLPVEECAAHPPAVAAAHQLALEATHPPALQNKTRRLRKKDHGS